MTKQTSKHFNTYVHVVQKFDNLIMFDKLTTVANLQTNIFSKYIFNNK